MFNNNYGMGFNNPYGIPPQSPYTYQNNNNQNIQLQSFAYVNGIEGAKAFQLAPNQTMLLMDSDNPLFYMKTSNSMGQSSIKTFRFEEVVENEKNVKYVSQTDFDNFKNEINKVLENLKGGNE